TLRAAGPYVMGLGSRIQIMNLDPTWNPPRANNGRLPGITCNTDGAEGATMGKCIARQTIHEFGHALGFAHEHNRADRDDGTPGCPAPTQGSNGTVTIGIYDKGSIMSYCADYRNPVLTTKDIEAVRQLYGSSEYASTRKDLVVIGGTPNAAFFFNGG